MRGKLLYIVAFEDISLIVESTKEVKLIQESSQSYSGGCRELVFR